MIQCQFFRSGDTLVGFAVNGHDEADEHSGVSLLCAAVSSAAYMTVNTLTDVCKLQPLVLETADGLLTLRLSAEDAKQYPALLEGLLLHLQALKTDYEHQLTIKITEV